MAAMGAGTCGTAAPGRHYARVNVKRTAEHIERQCPLCSEQQHPAGSHEREQQRTMYSAGATYSTDPPDSSGRCAWSRRRPAASSAQKYSTGTSLTREHTLHEYRLRGAWHRRALLGSRARSRRIGSPSGSASDGAVCAGTGTRASTRACRAAPQPRSAPAAVHPDDVGVHVGAAALAAHNHGAARVAHRHLAARLSHGVHHCRGQEKDKLEGGSAAERAA